jgi:peptidoglycan-N-acetylmuramic acid deacetylase
MGYRLAFWSFAYKDWVADEQPIHEYALDKILGQLHPGSVILLHPKSQTNTEIFSELIDSMLKRGYTFKGLNEFPNA